MEYKQKKPSKDQASSDYCFSTEQTLMALERTLLAWIRTGLTALGIGIAISQFIIFNGKDHNEIGHRIGQFLVLWGVGLFAFALISYRKSYKKIVPKKKIKNFAFEGLTVCTIFLIFLSFILFWVIFST